MKTRIILALVLSGCVMSTPPRAPLVPAAEYSKRIAERSAQRPSPSDRARARLVADVAAEPSAAFHVGEDPELLEEIPAAREVGSADYNGPLSLGDPGVTASLWREGDIDSAMLRDERAFRPMDLITIVISEVAEGSKRANTTSESETTITAAINRLLGLDTEIPEKASNINPAELIDATSSFEFDGRGETLRRDSLVARISAMVVEVLPSGVLRVEGQKIIAMNSEEQVMVISGLVRPRDITALNEVNSAQVANMRIDYYGRGDVADSVKAGWLGRALRKVWPF